MLSDFQRLPQSSVAVHRMYTGCQPFRLARNAALGAKSKWDHSTVTGYQKLHREFVLKGLGFSAEPLKDLQSGEL